MIDILLVPSIRRGNGTGHLLRCFSLLTAFGTKAAIFLPDSTEPGCWTSAELRLAFPKETYNARIIEKLGSQACFKMIILDKRYTHESDFIKWAKRGTVIALDESGPAREKAAFIVDILPSPEYKTMHNISGLGYLALPVNQRTSPDKLKRVLVSFGGEDQVGLAEAFLKAAIGIIKPENISVISGAMASSFPTFPGVMALGPVQNLKEKLAAYDLVVCQFGLTAYEAAWAGCAVLLCSPSRIHEKLARSAGFVSLGLGRPKKRKIKKALANPQKLIKASQLAAPKERLNLASKLTELKPDVYNKCPNCGSTDFLAIFRNENKTCFECQNCSLIFLDFFAYKKVAYSDKAYFFNEYKAQYGRTYIEDIPNIRKMAAKRLEQIEIIREGKKGRLLDIGCAYGAFVAEAQERGWDAVGTDISEEAVEYTKNTFSVPAFISDFQLPGADGLYPEQLDCITMWFVIEHFKNLHMVLKRAGQLLKPGGMLAFSTPSYTGISGRKNLKHFFESSPGDHYTIWSPKTVTAILNDYDFKVVKILIRGHHPERFSGYSSRPGTIPYNIAMLLSRLLKLGDTFECYAVFKQNSCINNSIVAEKQ